MDDWQAPGFKPPASALLAMRGEARLGVVRRGLAWSGVAQPGQAMRGTAGKGLGWLAGHGTAGRVGVEPHPSTL